jgi:hypothetical protein
MSTSIATVPSFAALSPDSAIAEVIEANLGGGSIRRSDLTWVKIPTGGSTRWNWSVAGNEFSEKTITGLCVVVTKTEYNLWPQSTATSGSLPFLRSLDGVTGHRIGQDAGDLDLDVIEAAKNPDGTYRWKDIPYCLWIDHRPPRAKPSRVVGVLREGDPSPIFLQVSPTSLKPVDEFLRALSAQFVPHYRAVVEMGLQKRKGASAEYAVLTLKHVATVDAETGARAKSLFTDSLTPILTGSTSAVLKSNAPAIEEKVPF